MKKLTHWNKDLYKHTYRSAQEAIVLWSFTEQERQASVSALLKCLNLLGYREIVKKMRACYSKIY